jgi:hypothetical protein
MVEMGYLAGFQQAARERQQLGIGRILGLSFAEVNGFGIETLDGTHIFM